MYLIGRGVVNWAISNVTEVNPGLGRRELLRKLVDLVAIHSAIFIIFLGRSDQIAMARPLGKAKSGLESGFATLSAALMAMALVTYVKRSNTAELSGIWSDA